MDDLCNIHETTVSTSVCLTLHPDLLRQRVADLRLAILAAAFAEIDRVIDRAFVVPSLRAPAAEVTAVAVAVEAVKEPLRRRLASYLEEDRRVRNARAEDARHRMPRPELISEPVRAPAWSGIDTLEGA